MITTAVRSKTRYKPMRDHDYLFDSTFTVAGEKDHNKFIFKTAMATAQMTIVPIFNQMFSDLQTYPNIRKAYIPNAHLPSHVNLSYSARIHNTYTLSSALISGKERFRFYTTPKISIPMIALDQPTMAISHYSPEQLSPRGTYLDKSVQTQYRESSTQTDPYQPEFVIRDGCKVLPEVLILENVQIDHDFMKKGIDKAMVMWLNRQRAKKAWMLTEPSTSILSQLEYCEQRHREKDIEDYIAGFETVNADTVLSKVDRQKSARICKAKLEKLEKYIEKLHRDKERDLRKLEAKKAARELNDDNKIFKTYIPEKNNFITLNSTYLPTIEKLEDKLFQPKKNYEINNICSKINYLDMETLKKLQEHAALGEDIHFKFK